MKARITGTTEDGLEFPIGVFTQGVCIEDDQIIDMASRDAVLVRLHSNAWVSAAQIEGAVEPTPKFSRIFVQGVPEV